MPRRRIDEARDRSTASRNAVDPRPYPTFSFLVPTHREDRPLRRCLDSIAPQLQEGDEVIVVGDTHTRLLPGVEAVVAAYDAHWPASFRYLPHDAGHHCYGHCQLNYGLQRARGDYVHCNDDDDVWTPDAVTLMRKGVEAYPKRPLLFRFRSYMGSVYWEEVGKMERDHIGGHCLVAPNTNGMLGRFTCAYNGDFDWIESTVSAYGGPQQAIWIADIICHARPSGVPVA